MKKTLFLLHRYLGIVFGLLISAWCLSAFVMMYVRYPDLTSDEELAGYAALDLTGCCRSPLNIRRQGEVRSYRFEMFAGKPVLHIDWESTGTSTSFDLVTGHAIDHIGPEAAQKRAIEFVAGSGLGGTIVYSGLVQRDQWTVSGDFNRHRPLYKFSAVDPAATEIYVSSTTGEVVQQSTGHERFWNWSGAVTHWLYLTALRQHASAWYYTVVWTSVASGFLIAIGIYIGIKQYGARHNGRKSPYRGAALWHHYAGLLFGLLIFAWVFSGLLSMNPWGLLAGDAGANETRRLAGVATDPARLSALVAELPGRRLPADTVRIQAAPFTGTPALVAFRSNGEYIRLHSMTLLPLPLALADLEAAAKILAGNDSRVASANLIEAEDEYYFGHHAPVHLPAYRIVLDDAERTRYYLHPGTGRLLLKVDGNRRWYRWLFEALHRGDFGHLIRRRPVWDILMLVLLTGVSILSLTGTYMGWLRLRRRKPK
jgi:hypothetical protein